MANRSEHIEKMKAKLDQLDAKIDLYEAKVKESSADAKIKYQDEIEQLKEKRKDANEWVNKVTDASEDAWDSLKDGFADAYNKIEHVFKT